MFEAVLSSLLQHAIKTQYHNWCVLPLGEGTAASAAPCTEAAQGTKLLCL